jgi:hypothetical protein
MYVKDPNEHRNSVESGVKVFHKLRGFVLLDLELLDFSLMDEFDWCCAFLDQKRIIS